MDDLSPAHVLAGPTEQRKSQPGNDRGCLFFNFGRSYVLRLLVSVFTLRRVYDGPVTVFHAGEDDSGVRLKAQLKKLDCDVVFVDRISKSWDRHRFFQDSPYRTTLVFDSDLLFFEPFDELWEPLEREGLLLTRFFPSPYGVDGSPDRPGWANRVGHLESVRGFLDADTHAEAFRRLVEERIDINVGVMGISRPLGEPFLADWSERMERGRSSGILLFDEMLTVGLAGKYPHYLADEKWNCPADEFFRRTNLADARIIHYFADGLRVHEIRLGRNPFTWAGKKWYEACREAGQVLDLGPWKSTDPAFDGLILRLYKRCMARLRFGRN